MQHDAAPWRLTATAAARRIAEGSLTAEALMQSCLERIAAREPFLRAWTHIEAGAALRQARNIDKATQRGLLHGLPFGVKDMIDAAGLPTTHNSPLYQDGVPADRDAACVAVARAEGALVLGKTDTVEFAAGGRRALTRNPYNGAHSPGGSSSGSAAAVADGMVPLAFGTQTGGSTIRPASFCGVYAIKPTHGLVNREGAKAYSYSLDTIGWYARCPQDLALMAAAFRMPAPAAPREAGRPLRIALCRGPSWESAEPAAQQAMATAAARLADAGHTVSELVLPEAFAGLNAAQRTVMFGEGRAAFLPEYLHNKLLLHQDFRDRVENSTGITADRLRDAYDLAAACRREFDRIAMGFDAVLTPSATGEAPDNLADTGNPVFNAIWTLLHVPCVAIPCIQGPQGLPVGVQIVGPRFGDLDLLAVAAIVAPAIDPGQLPPGW
jgi:Asp-tRNA(Asn)/Glu-tRNA(Gln) amidotransferase A subunit family amidase